MIEILATIFAGTFFGAAIYINLAQHPATLAAGGEFAGRFFPPMYRAAATMQVSLALGGTLLGAVSWYLSGEAEWLIGAILLVAVIPVTLVFIKPLNDRLLAAEGSLPTAEITELLQKWNRRHWIRSITSGASFICYVMAGRWT